MPVTTRLRPWRWLCSSFALWWLLSIFPASAAERASIRWVTEEYPPHNYHDAQGQPTGIFIDILKLMWERLDIPEPARHVEFYPWARAYQLAQEEPGVCVFAMTITPARRQQFAVVTPVMGSRISIVGRKGHPEIHTLDDLAGKTVGVVNDDIGEQLLQQAHANVHMVHVDSSHTLVRMLAAGRFDFIAYGYFSAMWLMRENQQPADAFQRYFDLKVGELGFGCQKDTDPRLIHQLQQTVNELRRDGSIGRITHRYISGPEIDELPSVK